MSTRAEKLSFAEGMVTKLQAALGTGASIVTVSTDGVSTTFDRKGALQELEYWEKQVWRYSRDKSRSSNINLSGSHD